MERFFFNYLEKKLKYSHIIIANTLLQACTTYGPQAACSPLGLTVYSMTTFGNNIRFKKCNCFKAIFFSDWQPFGRHLETSTSYMTTEYDKVAAKKRGVIFHIEFARWLGKAKEFSFNRSFFFFIFPWIII